MKKISHIDLFSGIGGFAYAIDQIFYEQKIKHIFVENDPFCQAVLRKHWPEAEIHGDIRAFTNAPSGGRGKGKAVADEKGYAEKPRNAGKLEGRFERPHRDVADTEQQRLERKEGGGEERLWRGRERCFILTGGFPCQPFSQAGVRKGTADDRYLWPEMLRVISEFRPEWVIAENVAGLLSIQDGMVFEQVCADLENEGYEVWPFVIPACAVGAPHQRKRIWIIGHAKRTGQQSRNVGQGEMQYGRTGSGLPKFNATKSEGGQSWKQTKQEWGQDISGRNQNAQISFGERGGRWSENRRQISERQISEIQNTRPNSESWERSWQEVAFATCHDGMDDGLSRQMDRITISSAKHRQERLKACGNAIVPQVAMKILEAIKYIENCHPKLL